MKIGSILILMIVTMGLLAVPAVAIEEILSSNTGFTQTPFVVVADGASSLAITNIYIYDIQNFKPDSLKAIKWFAKSGEWNRGTVPLSLNTSWGPANLTVSGTVISTGYFGWEIGSTDNALYLVYFALTWNAGALSGEQTPNLNWPNSSTPLLLGSYGKVSDTHKSGFASFTNNNYATYKDTSKGDILVETETTWYNRYINTSMGSYDTIDLYRDVGGSKYASRVIITGGAFTYIDDAGITDLKVDFITHKPYYLSVLGNSEWFNRTFYESPVEQTWDLNVIVRDASTSGLYDGATVTKTDLTDPYYNGWGTTYSGIVTFQAITGHEYNFSASAVGYTTGYANYSAITPINPYVSIWIYPIGTPATGYGYLDFMVRDSVGNTIEQAQVHLTDGQTKYTLMGYTRFNVTASTVIGYSVMKENYNTVTGNITSTTGTLTIPIILYNTGEGPTPTPTLDRRTSQQKFIDAGAVFANNAELFASLIVMAVMISLIDKVTLGSLSRAFGGRRKGK